MNLIKNKKFAFEIRNCFGYPAIVALIAIMIMFTAMYYIAPVFETVLDQLVDDEKYVSYSESECDSANKFYYDSLCHDLSERANETLVMIKTRWYFAPIIFAISMLIWFLARMFKDDPQANLRF